MQTALRHPSRVSRMISVDMAPVEYLRGASAMDEVEGIVCWYNRRFYIDSPSSLDPDLSLSLIRFAFILYPFSSRFSPLHLLFLNISRLIILGFIQMDAVVGVDFTEAPTRAAVDKQLSKSIKEVGMLS